MNDVAQTSTIPYFSNPDKVYEGIYIGDRFLNNASMWRRNYTNIINFRIVPDDLTVTASPTASGIYHQYRSNNNLSVANINIPNNKTVSLKSKSITIQNGFSIEKNGSLELITE